MLSVRLSSVLPNEHHGRLLTFVTSASTFQKRRGGGKAVTTSRFGLNRHRRRCKEPVCSAGAAQLLLELTAGLCSADAELLGHVLAGWEAQGVLGAGSVLHLVVQVDAQAGGAQLLLGVGGAGRVVSGEQVVGRSWGAAGGRLHVCQQDTGHEQLQADTTGRRTALSGFSWICQIQEEDEDRVADRQTGAVADVCVVH